MTINLEHEVKTSFIAYAMAVIVSRALPDVRDGLKPVHRRILYSMDELGMQPDKPFRKSARIVGDVLGKYHPHGDTAVYDAMVRLAQDFSTRYPLISGHGNFGSVDGDGAAAMRYTEARMSKMATEMLADLEKDTVDFGPNFDETLQQPLVLPARFPNLLVNGSGGIAVGMATNIPPHNLAETINGLLALIDNPEISVEELMEYIPGPDFPTGAIIQGRAGIASAYRTGRGKIVVRAKSDIEQMDAHRSRIIVTEIPYQVNKARLVERISELVQEKKVEGIADLRDETDRTGNRIVIELKRDVNAAVVLNNLYKHTAMQDTFGVVMLALVDGEPKVLTLKEVLYHYLNHQKDVVTRRTNHDLARAKERLHILEGLIIALDNIDEIIRIVRSSPDGKTARAALMEAFALSEMQAQAILDMRIQRLTGLERDKIEEEDRQLRIRVAYLTEILEDESKLLGIIKDEAIAIRDRHGDARRTEIAQIVDDIEMDDIIQEEDMVVTMTHFGYVKRLTPDTYRAQNRGGVGIKGQTIRDEDFIERVFVTSTHNQILFFTNFGRVFTKKCYTIPEASRQSRGLPVVNLLQLREGETVSAMFPIDRAEGLSGYLVTATRNGLIKKTPMSDLANIRQVGLIVQTVLEGDALFRAERSTGMDEFIIASRMGKSIRFSEEDVRATGRGGQGVVAIRMDSGDEVMDLAKITDGGHVLCVSANGLGKRSEPDQYTLQGRGGKGVNAMRVTDRSGEVACLKMANESEDLLLVRDDGMTVRVPVAQIPILGRATQGVKLMTVTDETRIACVALLPGQEEA